MRRLHKNFVPVIPYYSVIPLIAAFSFNMAVYGGARLIAGNWYHYNIETRLDRLIPFFSPAASVYLGCYLFWAVNYILIARQEKREAFQFFSADFLSRTVCFTCYLVFPTTNTRPFVEAEGFWNLVMLFVYRADAADNLFPSIHCLVSWLCFAGLRGKHTIPRWYQRASLGMAVLVCLSTLLTKQHVIADVIGGILLAEACLWLGKHTVTGTVYEKAADKVNSVFFKNPEFFKKGRSTSCREKRK